MELMTVICLFTIVESLPANQGAINLQEALRGGLLQTTDATAGEAQLWAKFWFIILTALTPREARVVVGFAFGGPNWRQALADQYDLQPIRVRQIFEKAICKLRYNNDLLTLLIESEVSPEDLSKWGYNPELWVWSSPVRQALERRGVRLHRPDSDLKKAVERRRRGET